MSKIKSRQAFAQAKSVGFSGIGSQAPLSLAGAADMCNFRICADGRLKTRNGYKALSAFGSSDESIRGVWEGLCSGNRLCFVACGQTVYLFDATTKSATPVGTLSGTEGTVSFFCYEDDVYLLDGEAIQIYRKSNQRFEASVPYAPLLGHNWDPTSFGDVNEEPNLLTTHMRIHYYNSAGTKTFFFPYSVSGVDVVRVNNSVTTAYTFTKGANFLTLTTSEVPTIVEVGIRVEINEEVRKRIFSSAYAYVHSKSEQGKEYVLLYGGENDPSLYHTVPVATTDLNYCKIYYRQADKLYIRSKDILTLGDRDHPVTSLCPMYDSVLAFDGIQTHLLSFTSTEITSSRIFAYGSVFKGRCPVILGKPVILNDNGVFLLNLPISKPEAITAKRISDNTGSYLPTGMRASALGHFDIEKGELWICTTEDTAGKVLAWNAQREEWYRFDNIGATAFFECSFGKGFAKGNLLYVFDDLLFTDDGKAITAYYQSNYFDLGVVEAPRRALRVSLCANADGCDAALELATERGTKTRALLHRAVGEAPKHYDFRFGIHRHRFLRFCIRTEGNAPCEVYKIAFFANP
ncbi:MAG: hypothetical protein IJX13_00230 [Clostridia bacterium]|nr:hypothetical protein [Clostridia bacterium]